MTTSRADKIKQRYEQGVSEAAHNLEFTAYDWNRMQTSLHVNGERPFADGEEVDGDKIKAVVDSNFRDPTIKDYIANCCNQHGFLAYSKTETNALLITEREKLISSSLRYDLTENRDGSVTFIERFNITRMMDEHANFVKPKEDGRPIAILVTESRISLDDKGQIKHSFVNDKILLVDPLAEQLFKKGDGKMERKYGVSMNDIENELRPGHASGENLTAAANTSTSLFKKLGASFQRTPTQTYDMMADKDYIALITMHPQQKPLIAELMNQIQKIKKDGGYDEKAQEWEKGEKYSHKYNVLQGMVEYLKGGSREDLQKIQNLNSGYTQKIFGMESKTEDLLNRVVDFKEAKSADNQAQNKASLHITPNKR